MKRIFAVLLVFTILVSVSVVFASDSTALQNNRNELLDYFDNSNDFYYSYFSEKIELIRNLLDFSDKRIHFITNIDVSLFSDYLSTAPIDLTWIKSAMVELDVNFAGNVLSADFILYLNGVSVISGTYYLDAENKISAFKIPDLSNYYYSSDYENSDLWSMFDGFLSTVEKIRTNIPSSDFINQITHDLYKIIINSMTEIKVEDEIIGKSGTFRKFTTFTDSEDYFEMEKKLRTESVFSKWIKDLMNLSDSDLLVGDYMTHISDVLLDYSGVNRTMWFGEDKKLYKQEMRYDDELVLLYDNSNKKDYTALVTDIEGDSTVFFSGSKVNDVCNIKGFFSNRQTGTTNFKIDKLKIDEVNNYIVSCDFILQVPNVPEIVFSKNSKDKDNGNMSIKFTFQEKPFYIDYSYSYGSELSEFTVRFELPDQPPFSCYVGIRDNSVLKVPDGKILSIDEFAENINMMGVLKITGALTRAGMKFSDIQFTELFKQM